jgi:hypothetical protein
MQCTQATGINFQTRGSSDAWSGESANLLGAQMQNRFNRLRKNPFHKSAPNHCGGRR